jgi:hypothetical protein
VPLRESHSRPRAPRRFIRSCAKDAELVAFGVGQHDPGSIPLADVHPPPRTMSDQSSHLGVLVIRPEIEVQSVLGLLGLVEPDELQPRRAIGLRPDLVLVSRGVDDNPSQRVRPPLPQESLDPSSGRSPVPIQDHRANLARPSVAGTFIHELPLGLGDDTFTSAQLSAPGVQTCPYR